MSANVWFMTLTFAAIATDVGGGAEPPPERKPYPGTWDLLERVFAIKMQPSWSPHLRSRARVRHRAKLHFVDSGLAVAVPGPSPEALMQDLNAFGLLFESLVIRDLRDYAQRGSRGPGELAVGRRGTD